MKSHAENTDRIIVEIPNHRCAAIIIRDAQLLLMFRKYQNREFYVLVGGHMHAGESQDEALRREVMEEASIIITNAKLAFEILDYHKDIFEHYYLCSTTTGHCRLGGAELARHSPENFYRLDWVPLREVSSKNLLPLAAKEWILETIVEKT